MKFCIVGGTGTLGKALVEEILKRGFRGHDITIVSRDELKQYTMKKVYPKLNYVLGDVRDAERMTRVIEHEVVFYAAALKQVDTIESNVEEAIKTNVLGSINVAKACQLNRVKHCILCSTDKAVLPINAYGYTKGLAEKYFLSLNTPGMANTHFTVCRWGNVLNSRGSVLPLFVKQIKNNEPLTVTDMRMTRFFMKIEDAARFMLDAYPWRSTKVMIPDMKAAPIVSIIEALADILKKEYTIQTMGIRPGEKLHEALWTSHDACINSNDDDIQYTHEELIALLEPIIAESV